MSEEFDPAILEDKGTEASGGDDDTSDTQPLLPSPPPQPPEEHPMTRLDPEQSGMSKRGPKTAEVSFIEETPSGRVWTSEKSEIELANERIKKEYLQYGENGKFLTLEVKDWKVFVVGPKGGRTRLFMDDNRTLNPQI